MLRARVQRAVDPVVGVHRLIQVIPLRIRVGREIRVVAFRLLSEL